VVRPHSIKAGATVDASVLDEGYANTAGPSATNIGTCRRQPGAGTIGIGGYHAPTGAAHTI
jgi:hypothetical protein